MFPIPYTLERVYLFIKSKMPKKRIRGSDIIWALFCGVIFMLLVMFIWGLATGHIKAEVHEDKSAKAYNRTINNLG